MDLRQLEHVVAVVDHGGFTRAAAALHIAQPSLSQSVRRLEADLGIALFLRTGRTVRLTDAGASFLGPARQLLRDAAALQSNVDDHAQLRKGTLDLVALPTAAADPLAALIGRFRSLHPAITVRVAEPADVGSLERMVLDGRCELGLGEADRAHRDGLVVHGLGHQALVAAFPPRWASLPSGDRVTLRSLAAVPLVAGPPGTSIRDVVDEALAALGLRSNVVVETAQREAIGPLVLAGAGVGVLPEPAALLLGKRGALVRRITPRLRRSLALLHRDAELTPSARAFLAMALG